MTDSYLSAHPAKSDATDLFLAEPDGRPLEVVLDMLERLVDLIYAVAHAHRRPFTGVLTVDVQDIPPEAFAALDPYLEVVRRHVRRLTASLALRRLHRPTRQRLHALLIGEMVRLDERADGMLSGFGHINPTVPTLLDLSLGAIRGALAAMPRLVDIAPNVSARSEAPAS